MSIMAALKTAFIKFILQKYNMDTKGGGLLLDCFVKDYKKHQLPYREIHKIHKLGFSTEQWLNYHLTEESCKGYMTEAQYYLLHPLNGKYSHLIDDKLSLKYICTGTKADFMPEYYFQIDENGELFALPDCPDVFGGKGTDGICECLRSFGKLAIKLEDGALGVGFFKAEYADGVFRLNGETVSRQQLTETLSSLRGYLITEYLEPHKDLACIWPYTANTIRYLVGKVNGKLLPICSFIRFGRKDSGFVDNHRAGAIICYLDENGCFNKGFSFAQGESQDVELTCHPDSGVELKGCVPRWDKIKEAVQIFSDTFPQLSYMGFDFAVTDKDEVKIIEINSLSGFNSLQYTGSVFETPGGEFFREKREEAKNRRP